jgi:hypothetical protein
MRHRKLRIDSNYKWLLLAFAVLWGLTLRLFWFERRNIDDQTIVAYSDREGGDATLSQPLCPQAASCYVHVFDLPSAGIYDALNATSPGGTLSI